MAFTPSFFRRSRIATAASGLYPTGPSAVKLTPFWKNTWASSKQGNAMQQSVTTVAFISTFLSRDKSWSGLSAGTGMFMLPLIIAQAVDRRPGRVVTQVHVVGLHVSPTAIGILGSQQVFHSGP